MPPAPKHFRRWPLYCATTLLVFLLIILVYWAVYAVAHGPEWKARERVRRQIADVQIRRERRIRLGMDYHPKPAKLEAAEFVAAIEDLKPDNHFALEIEWLGGTDNFLRQIKGLQGIEELYLHRCDVTEAGFADIASFPNLESLILVETSFTDAAIERLAPSPMLRKPSLNPWNDKGLTIPAVLALPHLRSLTLYDCPKKWFSPQMDELRHATMLNELTLVYVDPAIVEPLRAALPNCDITARTDDK